MAHSLASRFSKSLPDFLRVNFESHFVAGSFGVRENPKVSVLDFVTHYFAPNHLFAKSFLLRFGNFFSDLEIIAGIWYVPNPAIMLLGDNLNVPRRLWMNVEKSEKIIILIDHFRWNLLFYDFAKNAVFHLTHCNISDRLETVGSFERRISMICTFLRPLSDREEVTVAGRWAVVYELASDSTFFDMFSFFGIQPRRYVLYRR